LPYQDIKTPSPSLSLSVLHRNMPLGGHFLGHVISYWQLSDILRDLPKIKTFKGVRNGYRREEKGIFGWKAYHHKLRHNSKRQLTTNNCQSANDG
jgi:hypothetical protein